MGSEYYKCESEKRGPEMTIVEMLIYSLRKLADRLFFSKNVDKESDGHIVKKQLRCAISSCFDKNNICCKVCDIKKCRFKCNFIDKEVCDHQKLD
ncbi:MAG TPA: hypothetical protein VEB00_12190 [Clostridia bacterium]|nr:hypothetical protein [Clostridia bacterium]